MGHQQHGPQQPGKVVLTRCQERPRQVGASPKPGQERPCEEYSRPQAADLQPAGQIFFILYGGILTYHIIHPFQVYNSMIF